MTLGERESHEKKHARYRCQAQGCIYNDRGFASENYLRKHMKDYHSASASIKNRSAGADEVQILFTQLILYNRQCLLSCD